MYRIQAPILIVPTPEARQALGVMLRPAALAAHREIAMAAKGLEIAYHQFAFGDLTLAVSSRVRKDGVPEIEIGLGDPGLPRSTFTMAPATRGRAARQGAGKSVSPMKRRGLPVHVPAGLGLQALTVRNENARGPISQRDPARRPGSRARSFWRSRHTAARISGPAPRGGHVPHR